MSRDVPRRSPWTAAAARPGPLLALAAVVGALPYVRWVALAAVTCVPVALILAWRSVALLGPVPQLFQVVDTVVLLASVLVLARGFRHLRRGDVWLAAAVGAVLGALVPSTRFYPLLAWLVADASAALVALFHGTGLAIALLAGIAILRRGGPVRLRAVRGHGRASLSGLGFGALIGLPLAALNAYANTLVQGRPFVWRSSVAPLIEALQPGVVEEIVYRFALLGIVWLLLRPTWGRHAAWLAGLATLLVHTFAHNGDLLVADPLAYLAFGAVLAVVWGVPLTVLALRRDLESAVGFHWVQDAARFLGGL